MFQLLNLTQQFAAAPAQPTGGMRSRSTHVIATSNSPAAINAALEQGLANATENLKQMMEFQATL